MVVAFLFQDGVLGRLGASGGLIVAQGFVSIADGTKGHCFGSVTVASVDDDVGPDLARVKVGSAIQEEVILPKC